MRSSEVRFENGVPALYVDGERRVPMLFGLSDIPGSAANSAYAQKNIAQFAAKGIHLVTADAELRDGWHRVSPFEWEPMQEEIAAVQQADPDTGVILRLHVNAPYWWMRDHPEECVSYRDHEVIDDGDMLRLIRGDMIYHLRASIASRLWLEEAGRCVRTFCEQVWDTPEGRGVLGIQVACGWNGEWHQWGPDISRPMEEHFHAMLREKYGTDEALQAAWGDPSVTIETAPFRPEHEQPGEDGLFRDPVRGRAVMDAQLALQSSVTDAILYFCDIIKKSWGRPVLTGSFYGYYIGTGDANEPITGHLLPEKLYERHDIIDFLCGPFPYMQNRNPNCVPMQRGLLESNRLRQFLWLTEMDQHPEGTQDFIGGDPERMDETVATLRRNTLQPMLAGQGLWFYDHRLTPHFLSPTDRNPYCASIFRKSGWWDNPLLMDEIGRLRDLAEKYMLRPYRAAADVLIVYTPAHHFATAGFVEEEYAVQEAIARAGVAYDCIYLNELEAAEMDRYRCIIFPNASVLTEAERLLIHSRTMGKQVVWLYAAGYSDGHTLDAAHIRELTGISVTKIPAEASYRTASGAEIMLEPWDYSPFFAVDDPDAMLLARYPVSGLPAAARKGDSWYFSCQRLDRESLLPILDAAGAHRYVDSGDPIIAGFGLVALNCWQGGSVTLRLPNGLAATADLPPHTTAVWDAETGKRVL